ncbi:MAG: hypothetical protein LBU91_08360, partial [Bacteroidales bacterium]|nr:hypothetical protein [Bacteroidales bacterium]
MNSLETSTIQMQNAAYRGTDFILFSKPKFLAEMRMEYGGLNFSTYTPKLFEPTLRPDFTSIGIIPSARFATISIS